MLGVISAGVIVTMTAKGFIHLGFMNKRGQASLNH